MEAGGPATLPIMLVRGEQPGDVVAIAEVHAAAFAAADGPRVPVEVGLVAALRASQAWIPELSKVAMTAVGTVGTVGTVAGHVLCTRAHLGPRADPVLGLGPVGVVPAHQGRGVGSALVHAVLGAADARHEPLVALLGEPSFYRRFGFLPAAALGIEAPDPPLGRVLPGPPWRCGRRSCAGPSATRHPSEISGEQGPDQGEPAWPPRRMRPCAASRSRPVR